MHACLSRLSFLVLVVERFQEQDVVMDLVHGLVGEWHRTRISWLFGQLRVLPIYSIVLCLFSKRESEENVTPVVSRKRTTAKSVCLCVCVCVF
jgi:hypothetical protein